MAHSPPTVHRHHRRPWLDNVGSAIHNHAEMERPLGAAAALLTWLGWLTICPALGFPTLGTAGMVNRAIFGVIDPSFWVGWVIMIASLLVAIAVFFILERAHLVRASIRTGVIYGAALWLFAGVVIMPLIGVLERPFVFPPNLPGFQPADAMQGTVMMYSLGPLASVAALIAWVLFGAILGVTGSAHQRSNAASVGVPAP
jgi:hypothetical protein